MSRVKATDAEKFLVKIWGDSLEETRRYHDKFIYELDRAIAAAVRKERRLIVQQMKRVRTVGAMATDERRLVEMLEAIISDRGRKAKEAKP
jgi:hypothetical protein